MLRGILIGLFWGTIVSGIGLGVVSIINDPPELSVAQTTDPVPEPVDETPIQRATTEESSDRIQDDQSGSSAQTVIPAMDDAETVQEPESNAEASVQREAETEAVLDAEATDQTDLAVAPIEEASSTNTDGLAAVEPEATQEAVETAEAETASDTQTDVAAAPIENSETQSEIVAQVDAPVADIAKDNATTDALDTSEPKIAPLVPPQDPMTETPADEIIVLLEDEPAPIAPSVTPKIANLPTVNGSGEGSTFASNGSTFASNGSTFAAGSSSFATEGARETVGQTIIPNRENTGEGTDAMADAEPMRHSAMPVDTDGKPLFSIILQIDDPAQPGPETLVAFPYPVSFAVSLDLPDAKRTVELIRDLGYEAFVTPSWPDNAQISDVITSLDLQSPHEIEAVGLLERDAGDFNANRDITTEMISYASGHQMALLYQSKGLNSALSQARKEGVPAADIFRNFSQEAENTDRMRRSLDQAVLRAAEDRPVIVMGRLSAQTISALILWGLQDRASRVALVPASQILSAQ